MERLTVKYPKYIVQAMDSPLTPLTQDEQEPGLGYQNTLVSIRIILKGYIFINTLILQVCEMCNVINGEFVLVNTESSHGFDSRRLLIEK